jgi:hypothetical protein
VLSQAKDAAERLGDLDQAILAKAFRGELVAQDPNDEPAGLLLDRIRAEQQTIEPAKLQTRQPRRPRAPDDACQPNPKRRTRRASSGAGS